MQWLVQQGLAPNIACLTISSLILFAILQVVKNMRKRKDGMRMKNRANILVVLMETLETLSGNIAGSAILANAFHINLYL